MSESAEQLHKRLCSVIAAARFEVLFQPYAWEQVSEPSRLPANALAVVRDGSAWYALTSAPPNATGAYRILVFHFAEGSNASGFVAWLAGMNQERPGAAQATGLGVARRRQFVITQPMQSGLCVSRAGFRLKSYRRSSSSVLLATNVELCAAHAFGLDEGRVAPPICSDLDCGIGRR